MFLYVHKQICIDLEDQEQYHYGQRGFNPGCRKDRSRIAPKMMVRCIGKILEYG